MSNKAEIELLFRNLGLIAVALAAAGVLILISAGLVERKMPEASDWDPTMPFGLALSKACAYRFAGFRGREQRFLLACSAAL